MGVSSRRARPASRVTFDWLLLAIIIGVAALVAASWIRVDAANGTAFERSGTIATLEPDEGLIAFEDYSRNAGGWPAGTPQGVQPTLGGVHGPFDSTMPVTRTFAIPDGTDRVRISVGLVPFTGGALPDIAVELVSQDARIWRVLGDNGTQRIGIVVDDPGPSLTLDLRVLSGDAAWALDNLVVAARSAP